jgi:hypothetical protein
LYLIAARISGLGDLEAFDGIEPWQRARNRAVDASRFDPGAVEAYLGTRRLVRPFSARPGRGCRIPASPWT